MEDVEIRAHRLEEIASNIRRAITYGTEENNSTLERLRKNRKLNVIITNTYDPFCKNVCGLSCDDRKNGLQEWDNAFIELYGMKTPLNPVVLTRIEMTSKDFIKFIENAAGKRTSFAISDPSIGEVSMTYKEKLNYLKQHYFR